MANGTRRLAAAAVAFVLLAASCEPASEGERAESPPSPSRRPPTRPSELRLDIEGTPGARRLERRSIRDLKRLGFFERLTRNLYIVRLDSRVGPGRIPGDRHLADARLTAEIDERGAGGVCDIMFFPSAIVRDLRRQRAFRSEGRLPAPAPSLRQFWVALVAHELAHCLVGPHGEGVAKAWERRVLRAARRRL